MKRRCFCEVNPGCGQMRYFRVFAQEDPVDTTGFSAEQVGQEAVSDVVYESILGHYCIKNRNEKPGWMSGSAFLAFSLI